MREHMDLVGGPWCGRRINVEQGWLMPDVFRHRDLVGKYVRVKGTNRFAYRDDSGGHADAQ